MQQRVREDHLQEPALQHARGDFVRVLVSHTVGEALAHVQRSRPAGRIVYFYVVDDKERLKGVVPTRRLLLSKPETPVAEIMVKEIIALPATATLLEACEFFMMHRLLAFPILDAEGRILGIVDAELYTEEISDLARREESEDVFQLIGVRLAQVQQAALPMVFRRRFPWLLCNIGGGLVCAFFAAQFEDTLQKVIVLSLFIPVVLAVAESVSIQTLSLSLQAHHGNRFRWGDALRGFLREVPMGLLLGLGCGLLIGAVVLIWKREGLVALSMMMSITLAVTTAATLG
ncbi:MAG: CBS domain-containing protein, partial [Planctomycetaceae bacterium]